MNDIIFKTLLLKGEAGNNIIDIKKTSSNGLVDTYTITRTDGVTTTFEVTNGKSITDIKKTGSTGLVDTYTTTYNDGTTSTFTVTNGKDGKDGGITVDDALSETSTNPVQNKVITNSINDVTSKLQNLQVGGRNYLLGSNVKTNQGYIAFSISDINALNQNLGKPITLSIRYTAKNWTGRRLGFEMNVTYEDGTTLYPNVWIYDSADGSKTQSATYILPIEHGKIKLIEYPGIYVQGTTAGTATVYQPKLEIGNIATDWSPAPEDLAGTPIPNSDIDTILNS